MSIIGTRSGDDGATSAVRRLCRQRKMRTPQNANPHRGTGIAEGRSGGSADAKARDRAGAAEQQRDTSGEDSGSVADHAAQITKSQFMPNLYAGSGAGYTYGIPETPGGRAPSIFNVTYTEQIFNEPLRGQAKEMTGASPKRKRFCLKT